MSGGADGPPHAPDSLDALAAEIVACRACPRLVEWRERVGREKRAAFAQETYWVKPVPGFGDPAARVLVLGLAPAAHGANRTGRVFTGDRSGDWLFAAMHRTGFANQPTSTGLGDGLVLRDAWVTATVRCAPPGNRPLPAERDACTPYLVRELALLSGLRAIVCLGGFAWQAALRVLAAARPAEPPAAGTRRFGHGAEARAGGYALLASYHPSQQNTFTGRLVPGMLEAVLERARELTE